RALVELHESLGPLRTAPKPRVLARLFWRHGCSGRTKERLEQRLAGLRELAAVWPERIDAAAFRQDLSESLTAFVGRAGGFTAGDVEPAAEFLTDRLVEGDRLPVSRRAVDLAEAFRHDLTVRNAEPRFRRAIEAAGESAERRFEAARGWLAAFLADADGETRTLIDEAAVLLLDGSEAPEMVAADSSRELTGLLGEHPTIENGRYRLDYHGFFEKLGRHSRAEVPRFRRFAERKHEVLTKARDELRLDELKPRVMAAFVRNRLIDAAYLPLIGANLAKQIGVAGEETRADRQGMLLLVSPPGYGKTTLMEYVADRLGLVFLKVNGPAIGHSVTSLDPAAAPNLAAREELKKLGLGFEMGDNVMIYVDDIQHCHPEFLQKFISLCDAQRKVEGVWRGEAKTYDLRGRKVAVVMAGNPYTESGEKFKIPDMLANRADVYNLGDVTGRHRDAFELSFIENALTSNGALS
ncbi:MAG TPA: AAA family ATPase, partial [Planctomycetaceae bacterium]